MRSWAFLIAVSLTAADPDIVIYGGTAAGFASAIQAARMGHNVTLVAPERHIGGMVVEGLGSADINNHWFRNDYAVGGIAAEFYMRVGRSYGKNEPIYRFESKVAEQVIEEMIREAGVAVDRGQRLTRVAVRDGKIESFTVESGRNFAGRIFIDATIEGDLVAAAGIPVTWGREANAKYGETKNGIRADTTHAQFKVRVDPYRIPGKPESGLIPTIQDEPLGTPGAGDDNIQAFCFRLCLTKNHANKIPFKKPEGFDRSQYEIYFRYVRAGGQLWTPVARLPNGKTDMGSWHDLSANLYGMNKEWPNGDHATRDRIFRDHKHFTQGLLWLLANDPEMPGPVRAEWRQWGLCADEFTDNGGWPRQLYVRDGRRMVSSYVVTEHHTRRINPTPVADPVAVAFWPTDTHSVRRIVRDGAAYNEGFVFDDDNWGPFGISYQAMIPPRGSVSNLISPTCLSASHVAYGAIRLEHTFFSLGQAAGTAAALAIRSGTAIPDVPYEALKTELLDAGQILSLALVPKK
jgi:hypothetical protein